MPRMRRPEASRLREIQAASAEKEVDGGEGAVQVPARRAQERALADRFRAWTVTRWVCDECAAFLVCLGNPVRSDRIQARTHGVEIHAEACPNFGLQRSL